MAEVLEFPSRESRAYAFLERELSALLTAKGADDSLIAFATETLQSVYRELSESSEFSFRVDLPANITVDEAERLQQQIATGIDDMRRSHHDVLVKLAARLVLTEMRLFQEQRPDD
ncbi:MAG: hypothetical protein V2I45_05505 [Halieaceae bacterium]|jgi:hypothetical protein|nr:hypothetical protein [Halieaceae bacterium]